MLARDHPTHQAVFRPTDFREPTLVGATAAASSATACSGTTACSSTTAAAATLRPRKLRGERLERICRYALSDPHCAAAGRLGPVLYGSSVNTRQGLHRSYRLAAERRSLGTYANKSSW